MPPPNDAPSLPAGTQLTVQYNGHYSLSEPLVQLLVAARSGYDWPAGTGAAASQQTIVNLESTVARRLVALNATAAHRIIIDVSDWAGNNANSHAQLVGAIPDQQVGMQSAIMDLITPGRVGVGIDALCELPGISLVIASKIFRFCSPQVGAAVDRHTSYFFNSLPVVGHGTATAFAREWKNRRHNSSRLAIYSRSGYTRNRDQYLESYLPMLARIANELNSFPAQYYCAATMRIRNWSPTDVEMAAYYWWACNGAR